MRKMKRILSMVLTVALFLSVIPLSATAAGSGVFVSMVDIAASTVAGAGTVYVSAEMEPGKYYGVFDLGPVVYMDSVALDAAPESGRYIQLSADGNTVYVNNITPDVFSGAGLVYASGDSFIRATKDITIHTTGTTYAMTGGRTDIGVEGTNVTFTGDGYFGAGPIHITGTLTVNGGAVGSVGFSSNFKSATPIKGFTGLRANAVVVNSGALSAAGGIGSRGSDNAPGSDGGEGGFGVEAGSVTINGGSFSAQGGVGGDNTTPSGSNNGTKAAEGEAMTVAPYVNPELELADATGAIDVTATPEYYKETFGAYTLYDIWVGDIQLTSSSATGYDYANTELLGTIFYDDATKTLTIKGLDLNDAFTRGGAIYTTMPHLNINLVGYSSLENTAGAAISGNNITIGGVGSLVATGSIYGVQATGSITINGGRTEFFGTTDAMSAHPTLNNHFGDSPVITSGADPVNAMTATATSSFEEDSYVKISYAHVDHANSTIPAGSEMIDSALSTAEQADMEQRAEDEGVIGKTLLMADIAIVDTTTSLPTVPTMDTEIRVVVPGLSSTETVKAVYIKNDGTTGVVDAAVMNGFFTFTPTQMGMYSFVRVYPQLTGAVEITGTVKYGETLTAILDGVNVDSADVSYQWKRENTVVGTGSSYTIVADDVGKNLTVEISGVERAGVIISDLAVPLKADVNSAPSAPTFESKTTDSITIVAVAGQEYSLDGGTWQDSGVFSGLNPDTAYSVVTRVRETAGTNASDISVPLSVTTDAVEIPEIEEPEVPDTGKGVGGTIIALIVIGALSAVILMKKRRANCDEE